TLGAVRVWDAATGQDVLTLTDTGTMAALLFSPDGKRLLGLTAAGLLKTWDPAGGRELAAVQLEAAEPGTAWALSPDGRWIAAARPQIGNEGSKPGEPTAIKVWDAATGELVRTIRARLSDRITLAFSPDGKRLAYSGGYRDRLVSLWDVATGYET